VGIPSPTTAHYRSQIAGLKYAVRAGTCSPDDPRLIEAQRNLRAQCLAERIEKVVKQFPPLTDEQLERIAALLRSGARRAVSGDDG